MSVSFHCWVAFRLSDDFPVGFGNANYLTGAEFRDDFPEDKYRVELITDQAERARLLDMHKAPTS